MIEVWNYSELPIKEGNSSYGYVAYYAKHVYTVNEQSKQTVTDDGYIFYEDGNEVYLLGYTGNGTSLTLPAASPSGKDYQIYQYAFRGGAFTSVNIPASVTSIGRSAFEDCSSLNAVYITDLEAWCGIDFGSDEANPLYYARHLYVDGKEVTDLHIPDGVTEIKPYAFCGGAFTSVTIPENVTSVGYEAFYKCSSLEAVYITDLEAWCGIDFEVGGYYSYSANPLYYAHHLYLDEQEVTDLHIPDSITEIKPDAFCGGAFRSVTIPEGVTSIGEDAFYGCSSLEIIKVATKNQNYSSQDGILYNKEKTKFVHIPKAVKGVVTIPESVTSIGYAAFEDCSLLTSITIPASVTSIGERAFYGCSSLTSITIPFVGAEKDGSTNTHFGYIFGASISSYNSTYVPASLREVIITGGTSIGEWAFSGCSSLTSITIPESVTSIGERAFLGCSSLTSITIPESVTSIGELAFYKCSSLTSITIPASVTSIGEWAFSGCSSLTSITIPESVTSIGEQAFYDCKSLTSITIPENVTSIGELAFYKCSSLTSITIPASVTSIGREAFGSCDKLIEVWNYSELPIKKGDSSYGGVAYYAKHVYTVNEQSKQTVTDGGYIFYEDGNEVYLLGYTGNGTSLTLPAASPSGKDYQIYQYAFCGGAFRSVTIPEGVTSIEDHAFSGCSLLESVTFEGESQLTSIGYRVFYNCSSLTSITIPFVGAEKDGSTNTHFGYIFGASSYTDNSTYVPKSLKEVIITGGTSIGSYAFYDCGLLQSVTFAGDSQLTSIGHSAFRGCSSLTSITIPASVTSIGEYAFSGCSLLESVTFEGDSQLTSIGYEVFYNCSSLTSITIPASVTSIGSYAFYDCGLLQSVTFAGDSQLTSIGSSAFAYCSLLQSITIPESVTSIGSSAFEYCSSLTSVIFERTDGWKVSRNSDMSNAKAVTVSNSKTAAEYLTNTYRHYYWKRY